MSARLFYFSAIFLGTLLFISEASYIVPRAADNSSLYRLPRNVWPEHYDIRLFTAVTSGDFTYKGDVRLRLRVTEKTNRVILHSDKLKVLEERTTLQKILANGQLEELVISDQSHDNDTQFYIVTVADELSRGSYLLSFKYLGEVLDDVFGFYRSSYRVNNVTRWIGVTQFSTTFARRAFPCMDEPGFKATFQLSIGHYGNETVSSNTFPESRNITNRPNYYITKFSRTPRMSTYLLGWAIHDFSRVNSTSDSRMWLWTRFEDYHESLRASPLLVDGPKIYSALEAWMALANPLSKIEHFAVPDFYFSAMENWGLITFRESASVLLPSVTPLARIHSSLVTLAHEYAHTWFGNLVTPDFWSVAWLKEGFATYFAYVAINQVHEDWRMMELFPVEVLQLSLLRDAEHHNRTMNGRNVGNAKSAKAAMDFVTYNKGASIIRMISDVVGEETFKTAMRSYLDEKKYEAAMPSDVYNHLELALNSSVKPITLPVSIGDIIETWANQPNYPLIRVVRTGLRDLQVFQEPFLLNRSKIHENDLRSWWIPLKFAAQSNLNKTKLIQLSMWLGPSESKIVQLPIGVAENHWFLLNPQQIGYYRVNYDSNNWNALKALLNSNDYGLIPITKRAALIDDSFNLARAGYETYELPLSLIRYVIQEKECEPWIAACRAILFLDDKLKNKPHVHNIFQQFARDLITPIYEELGFEEKPSDSHLRRLHRSLILSTACTLNLKDCVSNAKSIFEDWITNQDKLLPAHLKNFVYRVGIINGADNAWTTLWHRFLKTNFHSEREPMLSALAATENSSFINRYLGFSLDTNSDIAQQFRLTIIHSVITVNSKNFDTALDYIDSNLIKIINSKGITFLEGILSSIGNEITSTEQEEKFKLFVHNNANNLKNISESIKETIELVQENIAWINNCSSQILQYLP